VRLETSGTDYDIFSEGRATKYSCSVTCSQKSQRQTVASALRYSYGLASDLIKITHDCLHALVLLFAPDAVQGGQIGEYGRLKKF